MSFKKDTNTQKLDTLSAELCVVKIEVKIATNISTNVSAYAPCAFSHWQSCKTMKSEDTQAIEGRQKRT